MNIKSILSDNFSWAARNGYDKIARALLAMGADIEHLDYSCYTPLIWASRNGHPKVIRILLANGADVNKHDSFLKKTPLMWAAKIGQTAAVQELLDNNKISVDLVVADGIYFGPTAFMLAAENGHIEIMQLLLDKGANAHKYSYYYDGRKTALMLASEYGQVEAVNFLLNLDNDGSVYYDAIEDDSTENDFTESDSVYVEDGYDALMLAVKNNHIAVAEVLLTRRIDVNKANAGGELILNWAARKGYAQLVKFLLDHGADVNKTESHGYTALMSAYGLFERHMDVAKTLLKSKPHDLGYRNHAEILSKVLSDCHNGDSEDFEKIMRMQCPQGIFKEKIEIKNLFLKSFELLKEEHISAKKEADELAKEIGVLSKRIANINKLLNP